MDESRLKDEVIARLSGELERDTLQMIEAALLVVIRNYDIKKKETQLSTDVVTWPEYDIFMGRLKFSGYSRTYSDTRLLHGH